MAKQIFTHDQLPEFCQPIEVDDAGRTTKLEYKGYLLAIGEEYPMWTVARLDKKRVPEDLGGIFTSIDQCLRAINAVINVSSSSH